MSNDAPITPVKDFTPASKELADQNALDLSIGMTANLPKGKTSHFYAFERIMARCAALDAAYSLRRIFGGRC